MLRTREVPTAPLVLYAVGAVPISLRAFVPEAVLDLGLAVLAVGIAWLAIWLFNRSNRIATWTIATAPPDTPQRRRLTLENAAGPIRARPLSAHSTAPGGSDQEKVMTTFARACSTSK